MQAQNEPTRSMIAVTMNDVVFALIEDPAVPVPDLIPPPSPDVPLAAGEQPPPPAPKQTSPEEIKDRPHRRFSFVTIRPPESLELLLHQLQSKWVPVRQSSTTAGAKPSGAAQVTIDGVVFSIGTDWVVRAGNIVIAGGILKGMLLEAEYLPLPKSPKPVLTTDDTAEILSNLLTSLLPSGIESKTIVFPITDSQWDEVLFDTDDRKEWQPNGDPEDVFISAADAVSTAQKGDWTGVHRDQRSAFLVIGALKSEGIL